MGSSESDHQKSEDKGVRIKILAESGMNLGGGASEGVHASRHERCDGRRVRGEEKQAITA